MSTFDVLKVYTLHYMSAEDIDIQGVHVLKVETGNGNMNLMCDFYSHC
jgi:hypothetical protein